MAITDAGLSAGLSMLNNTCGNAVLNLAKALADCNGIAAMLNDTDRYNGQTGLVAAGMSAAGATLLLASFTDIAALYKVAHAQQQQVGNNDFFFHAKLLLGAQPMPI
jgi:hypothetical protein